VLFLLSVLDELDVPDRLADSLGDDDEPGLGGLLHRLAMDLVARALPDAEPPHPWDPALLAFCGHPDGDPPAPPGADDPARRRAAELALADQVGRILAELRSRLEPEDAPARSDALLLLAVCHRHAVIDASPGWIDVELDLDEVTVEVRRAGLDLDPGYLPWLGSVVMFRYA
jgi:hypothetical protein